ncbi:MAG: hypothetical protein U0796_04725 [Gemmatales bacterium]
MSPLCQHCHHRRITRPRQLCLGCFRCRTIRQLYAPKTTNKPKTSRRDRRLAPWATSAPPGSEAKVREMAYRHARGWALFHPHDWSDED